MTQRMSNFLMSGEIGSNEMYYPANRVGYAGGTSTWDAARWMKVDARRRPIADALAHPLQTVLHLPFFESDTINVFRRH